LPLPLIPIAVTALSAGVAWWGARKGLKAQDEKESAEDALNGAIRRFNDCETRVDAARARTNQQLEALGTLRLNKSVELIKPYVDAVQYVHRVEQKALPDGEVAVHTQSIPLETMRVMAYEAADLLKDGIVAVPTGVLAGLGAAGAVSSMGAASAGTAIATLSGVAASNATLAWLGGGSLAAGGWGVAGGTAVLGGVVLGPVIAVTGFVAAAKLEKQTTEILAKRAEYMEASEQLVGMQAALEAVDVRIQEIQAAIATVAERFAPTFFSVTAVIEQKKASRRTLQADADERRATARQRPWWTKLWRLITLKRDDFSFSDPLDFNNFSVAEQQTYVLASRMAISLYALLTTPVLDTEGGLTEESQSCIDGAQHLILAGA
jgi:hypothetical protein